MSTIPEEPRFEDLEAGRGCVVTSAPGTVGRRGLFIEFGLVGNFSHEAEVYLLRIDVERSCTAGALTGANTK